MQDGPRRTFALLLTALWVSSAAAQELPIELPRPAEAGQQTETVDPPQPVLPVVPMSADEFRRRTQAVLTSGADEARDLAAQPLSALPEDASPGQRLDAALQSFYALETGVRRLIDTMRDEDWAAAEKAVAELPKDPFVSTNVRAFVARTFIALEAFDEAADVLREVDVNEAIDPAGLLFLRAVCEHGALEKDAGLRTIARLLDPASDVSERHAALARLMRQDLEDLEDNELNQLSRQMQDVRRKLRRGKSGKKTQGEEQEIIEGLDRIIEKKQAELELRRGSGTMPGDPMMPAEEGIIGGPKGEGLVDKRPVGKTAGWGDLPAKAQTEARNLIENQFPPHYRRAVEEYYKKLAER